MSPNQPQTSFFWFCSIIISLQHLYIFLRIILIILFNINAISSVGCQHLGSIKSLPIEWRQSCCWGWKCCCRRSCRGCCCCSYCCCSHNDWPRIMSWSEWWSSIQWGVGGEIGEDVVHFSPEQETFSEVSSSLPLPHGGGGERSLDVVTVVFVIPEIIGWRGRLYGWRRCCSLRIWSSSTPAALIMLYCLIATISSSWEVKSCCSVCWDCGSLICF